MGVVGSEALKAKMQALGMRPKARTDGTLEGIFPFRNLVNAFTQSAILAATVRNYGDDAVVCIAPAHLAHLPAIRILNVPDAATFEWQVQQLYQRRLEKLREVNQFLSMLGLNAELDEPGFRVVSETWVGDDVVKFTVRPGQVIQVISIAGRSYEVVTDAKDRRVDARKVKNTADLEAVLEPLIANLKSPKARQPRPVEVPRLPTNKPSAPEPMRSVASSQIEPLDAADEPFEIERTERDRRDTEPPKPRPVVVPILPIDKPSAPEPVRSMPAAQVQPLPDDTGASPFADDLADDDFSLSLRKQVTAPTPAPGSQRPGAQMFDRSFETLEDEFSGLTPMQIPAKTPVNATPDDDATVQTVSSDPNAQLLALVCGECGRFYLVEENPPDVRLLDTCPKCLSRK